MPSPIRIRSKEEKRLTETAHALLDDPNTTTADKFKAMGFLERAIRLAEKRRARRGSPEPAAELEPADPTVDELVSQLEARKPPLQPIEPEGLKNGQNGFIPIEPAVGPTDTAKALEVTQEPQGPPVASCAFCFATGSWNTRFPVGQADGILLCPSCFSKMCASDMRQTAAAARARAEQPTDWAEDFAAQRNVVSSDFEKSRAIWAEQDRENADRQERETREHAQAEAQYHAARTRWIQDGGRL